ncbi:Hypothetical predicted protein [Mytilus galloprovincialis]|uniref:GIY-YIG domain-containing protein n=1 Tax=Mytilus galloprovincialis TaxID=29158 RepID=A0A8B6EEQ2_MYTGA|nr:Hypothetical predicted protein [Mytilus galloprovincialis]
MEEQSYEFKSGEIFTIKNSFTCASSNLIYVIRCNGCKKDYIGQTGNTLRKRFTVHRQQIRHKEIRMIKLQTEFAKKEERILEKVEVNKLRDIAVSDNEKLAIIVNLKEEKQTDLNHEFQNKLDEKDKMITALQDRIQNYLYDVNGDPWCKKVDNLNKREEKESITGTNNISMNEIQTINSQSVPNDEAYTYAVKCYSKP